MYQASYSAKGVTGGYSIHKQNRTAATTTADQELKMQTIALTYAATKDITLGLTQLKTTSELAGAVDEKIRALQVGYNLGPVSLIVSASKGENIANTVNNDADELGVRLSTKF
jgi:tRNA A37 threonylcarbamoyladenosine synthetase subunit TsaC/SUA5/YrdC